MLNQLSQCPTNQSPAPLGLSRQGVCPQNPNPFVNQLQSVLSDRLTRLQLSNEQTTRLIDFDDAIDQHRAANPFSRVEFPWDTIERISNVCVEHAKTCATIIPEVEQHDEIIIKNAQGESMCLGALSLCLLMAADCIENPEKFNSVELICNELQHYVDNPSENKKRPFFSDDRLVKDYLEGPCETLMPYCSEQSKTNQPPEKISEGETVTPEKKTVNANKLMLGSVIGATAVLLAWGLSTKLR